MKPEHLPPRTLSVLSYIVQHPDSSAATLQARLDTGDGITVAVALRSLVQHGLVSKTRLDRLWLYSATAKGRDLHAERSRAASLIAQPRHIHMGGPVWRPTPWRPDVARPGCMDHVRLPSLIGGQRIYRRDAGLVSDQAREQVSAQEGAAC